MATRKILVTGATGKQGGAVVKALLNQPPPKIPIEILALTRNTSSPAAKALAANPKVTLLPGDLDDCAAIFAQAGGKGSIWGVFLVTLPAFGNKKVPKDGEERQGKSLIDAAVANDVSHFVFSSVGSGGPGSEEMEPQVPHFVSKYRIEAHLRHAAPQGADMTWTILRPVAFMENMTPDTIGKAFGAMWSNMGDTKLQLVATKDIGVFAALAFNDPERFHNLSITLAGDDLTQAEGNEVFWTVLGRAMPRTYGFMANALQWMIPELGVMFKWFVVVGYKGDVAECKSFNPGMLDFGAWLKEESKFTSWRSG